MAKKITIGLMAISLTTAVTALAGLFMIEVPADLEREDVLNPTAAVEARLDALTREEIAKHPNLVEYAPVVFTKNAEPIYRDVASEGTDGWADNRLGFSPAGEFLWPENEGSWEAARWHLREVGQPDYNGVYALGEKYLIKFKE